MEQECREASPLNSPGLLIETALWASGADLEHIHPLYSICLIRGVRPDHALPFQFPPSLYSHNSSPPHPNPPPLPKCCTSVVHGAPPPPTTKPPAIPCLVVPTDMAPLHASHLGLESIFGFSLQQPCRWSLTVHFVIQTNVVWCGGGTITHSRGVADERRVLGA